MDEETKEKTLRSLVTVRHSAGGNGMGVCVDDDYILTAAHCLPRDVSKTNPFMEYVVEVKPFKTRKWARCRLVSIDPYTDLAVLSPTTDDDALVDPNFEILFRDSMSACVNWLVGSQRRKQPVYLYTHENSWLIAELNLSGPLISSRPIEHIAKAGLYFSGETKSGTSGAPVFDQLGAVIGLVSHALVPTKLQKQVTTIVVLTGALPRWVASNIQS